MSVVEALTALLAGIVLLAAGWSLTGGMARAAADLRSDAEAVEVHRLVGSVLDAELAGARPGVDVMADPGGLALRVFRGWGVVCSTSMNGVAVEWRGLRLPDPTKDSLELTLADGRQRVVALVETSAGSECEGSGDVRRLIWPDGSLTGYPAPVLVRVFERGVYSVTDAFRYRRGAGGRQPLTPAILDAARSELAVVAGAPEVRVAIPGGSVRTRRWVLPW